MPPPDHAAEIARLETRDEELYRRDDALADDLKDLTIEVRTGFEKLGDQIHSLQIRWATASGAICLASFIIGLAVR